MPKKVTKGLRKTREKVEKTKKKAASDLRRAGSAVAKRTNRLRSKTGQTQQQQEQRDQDLKEAKNEAKKLADELGAEQIRKLAKKTKGAGGDVSDALAELEDLSIDEAQVNGDELEVVRDDRGSLDVVFENDDVADGTDLNLTDEGEITDIFDERR